MSELSNSLPEGAVKTSYAKELIDVFNVAGWKKLTPEEQAWIREPEVPKPGTRRNEPQKQLFDMSLSVLEKEKKGKLTLESKVNTMPPYAFEVFRTAAVFTDKDSEDGYSSVPVAEESKVQEFIEIVKKSPTPLGVADQFDLLLELGDDSIVDAAAIGMMASRLVARNLDTRAYPNIHIDKDTKDKWHENLSIFEDSSKPNDVLGDNYYFWTSVYTATALSDAHPLIKRLDEKNAKIMTLSRQFFARQPTKTKHENAFLLGKQAAEIFVKVAQKPEIVTSEITIEYLETLPESIKIAVLVNKLQQINGGEELRISDPGGVIGESIRRFDTLEYFSALPGISSLYEKRPKGWGSILNEVRYKIPSISFDINSEDIVIKKRQSELSGNLKAEQVNTSWIKDRINEIEKDEAKDLLRQWIVIGTSTIDSGKITFNGKDVFKYNARQTLLNFVRYPDSRREYFSDNEWETVTDIISVCVDNAPGFLESPPTVFNRAYDKLARSALILPTDGITPRIGPELVRAVEELDSTKVSREDKMTTFAKSMDELDWYIDHKDDLDNLAKVDPRLRNIALFYLRQSVLSFLDKDMKSPREVTNEVFSKLLNQLRNGTDSERSGAREALNTVHQIGLEYESDPVYSLLAAMHDPSVYGTARYRLERRMIRSSDDDKLAIAYAKQIIRLTKSNPDQIIAHQKSLSRKLSCPSCYEYAGGMAAQSMVQNRDDKNTLSVEEVLNSKIVFANEMNNWIKG